MKILLYLQEWVYSKTVTLKILRMYLKLIRILVLKEMNNHLNGKIHPHRILIGVFLNLLIIKRIKTNQYNGLIQVRMDLINYVDVNHIRIFLVHGLKIMTDIKRNMNKIQMLTQKNMNCLWNSIVLNQNKVWWIVQFGNLHYLKTNVNILKKS